MRPFLFVLVVFAVIGKSERNFSLIFAVLSVDNCPSKGYTNAIITKQRKFFHGTTYVCSCILLLLLLYKNVTVAIADGKKVDCN